MGTARRIGLFGLLSLVLLGGVGAKEKGEVAPPKATGPQEAEVVGVVIDQRSAQPLVVLQGKRDKRNLAMVIGHAEANGIALPLNGITPPRPLTHDLFLTLFGRLKVTLTRVVITDLRDDIYYATVYLSAGGSELTLDSRPSDAIALAIRAKVPVLVEDRVFDKAGGLPSRPAPSPHF
ncbi:MAG: bifunctional nuclease family protein [Candidatus Rokubacteria bacterium]|nr:bifunctional nuclease family protein [Candidatus Rokubacteria bacterium]